WSGFVPRVLPVTAPLPAGHQTSTRRKRAVPHKTIRVLIMLCLFVMSFASSGPTCLAASDKQKKVLMLSIMTREAPSTLTFEHIYLDVLNRELGGVDFYSEFIDLVRFQEPAYQAALGDFLARKYANVKLDLVVVDSGI